MERRTIERILVVAAHPDDEILGCGAAIAGHAARREQVSILILGEPTVGSGRKRRAARGSPARSLREETRRANRIVGVSRLILKRFPDNQFDRVPLLRIVQTIEKVVESWQPTIIYTHWHGDLNIDHRLSAEAVSVAVRPVPGRTAEAVLAFEVPSATEWNFTAESTFRPNVFVALEPEFLEQKVRALKEYRTEVREFPHPRSPEYLRALATVRGGQAGFTLAEAFELVYWRRS